MSIDINPYDEKSHYDMIATWFEGQVGKKVLKDTLSDYGWIAFIEGRGICALWLYPTMKCKMMFAGNLIGNPNSTDIERSEAIDLLFDIMHIEARDLGYKYISAHSKNPSVLNKMENHGYMFDSDNVSQYFKVLGDN